MLTNEGGVSEEDTLSAVRDLGDSLRMEPGDGGVDVGDTEEANIDELERKLREFKIFPYFIAG